MKTRTRLLVLGFALAIVAVGGGATAGVTGSVTQYEQAYASWYAVIPGGSHSGNVSLYRVTDAAASGTSATPSAYTMASAYRSVCLAGSCITSSYQSQLVPSGALTMDVTGNSATIEACLLPSGGGACDQFSLALTRPSSTQAWIAPTCITNPQMHCPNAWYDPSTTSAFATTGALDVYLFRNGYTATGTVAGQPVGPSGSYGYTSRYVTAQAAVAAP